MKIPSTKEFINNLRKVGFVDCSQTKDLVPLDKVIYNLRNKILPLLEAHNIKYTELKPKQTFLYTMFEKPVKKRNGTTGKGYSWCGGRCRWGTTEKLQSLEKYCKGAVEYVGIAVDELKRLEKERKGNKQFPLAEWNMTEKDCLK